MNRVFRNILVLAFLLPVLSVAKAGAHELRPIIASFGVNEQGRTELVLSLNLEAAIAGIGAGHQDTDESSAAPIYNRLRSLSPADLSAEFDGFAAALRDRITLNTGDRRISFDAAVAVIPDIGDIDLPRVSEVTLTGPPPAGEAITWRFDPLLGNSVLRFRDPVSGEVIRAEFLQAGEPGGPITITGLAPPGWGEVFVDYLKIGFIHIVPEGLDHILFVLGLFLLSIRMSALLWQISAFTLAHTFTLALGATGVVTLPPSIVEPLIAASILYVAVENIFTSKLHRWRPPIVFCFGLLHGLGFAGVLGEIGLTPQHFVVSLLSFNVGVELGQVTVIAAAFLAVGWFFGKTWYRSRITIPGSALIAVVAAFWVVQRVGLIG